MGSAILAFRRPFCCINGRHRYQPHQHPNHHNHPNHRREFSQVTAAQEEPRYNEVNIQMLPLALHKNLFPDHHPLQKKNQPDSWLINLCQDYLQKYKIPFTEKRPPLPSVEIPNMPHLVGRSIEEHFWNLGKLIGEPYREMAEKFAEHPSISWKMGHMEGHWSSSSGWTKYSFKGEILGRLGPDEEGESVIVLDVETCPSHGPWPLMAVALSATSLYAWVSPHLFPTDSPSSEAARLIPLDPGLNPMLIIGHNVSYDRARLLSEYRLERGSIRFLDTLSLHCAVSGLSSQQRGQWKSIQSNNNKIPPLNEDCEEDSDNKVVPWSMVSAMNNLADAVWLHCGLVMDKSPREILVKGTLEDVRANFQRILTYCAHDVTATRALFAEVWPKFTRKSPHPVTFAALLEMGSMFLPVNETWNEYIERAEALYQQSISEINLKLQRLVEEIVCEGQKDECWRSDPWLRQLDWTPVPAKFTKERRKADGSFAKGGEPRPIGNVLLFGKPAWYKKLWSNSLKGPEITSKTHILPYLLRLKWDGFPVHSLPNHGWCFVATKDDLKGYKLVEPGDGCYYYKIPHEEDEQAKVGCLLSKGFLKHCETGKLSTSSPIIKEILASTVTFSFWVGYRERIKDQLVVWKDEAGANLGFASGQKAGLILPKIMTMGTVTRRAVEPTWMTASNPKKRLVGSELKSRIIAPIGYAFVGADVDSQELWISSLLGDAQFGFAGASPLGWMTLQGTKSDGTDLHSRTASILGMSRDSAKIFNYGRIYGAGEGYAAQLLQKFNPSMSKEEATKRARALYETTKGKKRGLQDDRFYSGGTESFMFNVLEEIADSPEARTPTLSACISDALVSGNVSNQYLTSRVNWAVQSSGVDYLHMLLVSMAYLSRIYGINNRLSLTIHDEVRFLSKEEDKYRTALALQIANLWTRTMFAWRVGMTDLPFSVAFFSAVDIDRVVRKEVNLDCITPSNPFPIEPGQALDIYELLKMIPNGMGPVDPRYECSRKSLKRAIDFVSLPKTTRLPKKKSFIMSQMGLQPTQIESTPSNPTQTILSPSNAAQVMKTFTDDKHQPLRQ